MLSVACVGAAYPNKRGPTRRFEIGVHAPGDPVELVHEPKNPADANAIMIVSRAGVLMGYVSADRTPVIHGAWQEAKDVRAIFQRKTDWGAWIRVGFDANPDLPPSPAEAAAASNEPNPDPGSGFWPDPVYNDD